ncbi:MAG: amidohydrolase [Mogibacterium sp.]|nr:amidohydrolase [Mogibacterium sp.]
MDIYKRAQEILPEVIANRRYLHQHPELGFQLDNTVAFVKEKLTEMGYEPKDIGDHGVTATVGGKKGGKCILIRADMDALPMKEQSGLDFASPCEGAAHTCGHDTHTAMLLGAAKILKEMEDELCGTVKLMFQPAEELISGAKNLVEAGILENPKVDAALGTHIFAVAPAGHLLYATGAMLASADGFAITIKGKGGHGSAPHTAIDPISVASYIVVALQELNGREVEPGKVAVLTLGCMQAGSASNIIPDKAVLKGTIRTFDPDVRNFVKQRMVDIVNGTAAMFRAEAAVDFEVETAPLMLDPEVMKVVGGAVKEILGPGMVHDNMTPLSGSEDFAYVSDNVPTGFFGLGAMPTDYPAYPQHSPQIRFNEDAFVSGVVAYAAGADAWLKANQ